MLGFVRSLQKNMSILSGIHHTLMSKIVLERPTNAVDSFAIFNRHRPLPIDLLSYLEHVHDSLHCSEMVFVLGLAFVEKIQENFPHFSLTSKNVHRAIFASIVVAFKFFEDVVLTNADLANIGRITVDDLFKLESSLLKILN